MDATLLAGVALDSRTLINDGQLVIVCCDFEILNRDDADDSEDSTCWLPTLGTSTGMVVENISSNGYFDFLAGAMAMQLPA